MNQEIKAKWIAALRSGQYKQGYGRLKSADNITQTPTYCCLGVLCEVMNHQIRDHYEQLPSQNTADEAGLKSRNPVVLYDGQYASLSRFNDGGEGLLPLSFNVIADIIEAQL